MSNDIDKALDKIDEEFDKLSKRNKKQLEAAVIKPIHDRFPLAQNGIAALIASMGKGKSYSYLKLAAKQEALNTEPFFELIAICSTSSKFDKTVNTFKEAIKKSKVVAVKDSDLLEWLTQYIQRMKLYNIIMEFVMNGMKNPSDEMQAIIKEHRLKNQEKLIKYISQTLTELGWRTYPHRCLLILDDFASHPLLRSKESELSRLLKKLRHFNINVIICVQTTKSIPKDIKRTLSDVILFTGISEEDYTTLMKELNVGWLDTKKLWQTYKSITDDHATLSIHIAAKKVVLQGIDHIVKEK